ncbi:MAG: hypothetical protein KAT68_00670 [Bacteroidales bacterium]|nr:hypothetical protein [Bacteroidales bacterium]
MEENEVVDYTDVLLGINDVDSEEELTELEGLEGRRRFSRGAMRRYAGKRVRKAVQKKYVTKGQVSIASNFGELSKQTQALMKQGKIQYGDEPFYIRKAISGGSGIIELFEDSIDKSSGVTNISKGKLATYINLAFERIEVNHETSTTVTDVKDCAFTPMTPATTDLALLNGEIEVIVAGKTLLKTPLNQCVQPKKGIIGGLANGFNLKAVKLVKEDEPIQIRLHIAAGKTIDTTAAKKDFIEVVMLGASTKQR